jgi:hypothetical protein
MLPRDVDVTQGRQLHLIPPRGTHDAYPSVLQGDPYGLYVILDSPPETSLPMRSSNRETGDIMQRYVEPSLTAYGLNTVTIQGVSLQRDGNIRRRDLFDNSDPLVMANMMPLHAISRIARLQGETPAASTWTLPVAGMAVSSQQPAKPLSCRYRANRLEIVLPAARSQTVAIRVLRFSGVKVRAAGHTLPTTMDRWGCLLVDVPSGARKLEVSFQTPWTAGITLGLLLFTLGGVLLWRLPVEKSR